LAAALPLLGQGPEVGRQLTAMGRRSQAEWTNVVRDAHDFSDIRRQQLVNSIYETRVTAAESALTKELGRTQLIRPKDRARLRYRVDPDGPMGNKIRRRAEQQANRIIETDRKFRESWADKARGRKWPLQNRYQINRELEQELEARSTWKTEQIVDTEYQQAGSEAITDFYTETEISDPEADPYWYFVGPSAHDPKTCPICRAVLAGQPYTQEGLIAALASAGAMAPEAFTAHPHERHQAQFKPPAGWVRRGDNTDAARGWACMDGDLEDIRTGELLPIDPPETTPKFIRTRFPETANNYYFKRTCGFGKACDDHDWLLLKWALRGGTLETALCSKLDDQQLGAYGESMVAQLFGATATPKQAPFDALIDKTAAVEIKTKRAAGKRQQLMMTRRAQERKAQYAAEQGLKPHTLCVLVDDEAGVYRILHREGFASYRLTTMDELATIDMATGAVTQTVAELPWEAGVAG